MLAFGPKDDQTTSCGVRFKGRWFAASIFHRIGQERRFGFREHEVDPTHWRPMLPTPSESVPAPSEGALALLREARDALEKSQAFVEASANAKLREGWGDQLDLAEKVITRIDALLPRSEGTKP